MQFLVAAPDDIDRLLKELLKEGCKIADITSDSFNPILRIIGYEEPEGKSVPASQFNRLIED